MKRFSLCLALFLFCSLAPASALSPIPSAGGLSLPAAPKGVYPLTIDTFEGLYYNARELPDDDILAIFQSFLSFRGGLTLDFESRLGAVGGFGAEIGVQYMLIEGDTDNLTVNLVDLPFRLKTSLTFGSAFKLEAFGGVLFAMAITPAAVAYLPYLDAGGRMALGPVYLEASYEFAFGPEYESFPRFGLGLSLPLSK